MAVVVVVGEVVLDRFIGPQGVSDVAGGSAANTALAMHVAGHGASLRARYSRDEAGRFLRRHAEGLGLDLHGSVDTDEPATTVEVTLSDGGTPTYRFSMAGCADWQWTADELQTPLPPGCDAIAVGSLAAVLDPGCAVLRTWAAAVRATGVLVAYDPNARPTAVAGLDADAIRHRMADWVAASDIVKVSDEDLAWIAPGEDALTVVRRWSTWGPRVVVLTAGAAGAAACMDGEVVAQAEAPAIAVVDTVGAGDTLMGWLVAGLVDSPTPWTADAVGDVLGRAVRAAAVTCTRQGCQPPSQHDL